METLYDCDPEKNIECTKEMCFINNGPCDKTTRKEFAMQNELRYYMEQMKALMEAEDDNEEVFKPSYIVTAVKLPTGAIEIAVNNEHIKEKVEYILEAYDDDMHLKTNPEVVMQNLMIV